jgi:hypothetical protein
MEGRVTFLACKNGLHPRGMAGVGVDFGAITCPHPAFRLASHFVGLASHSTESGLRRF